MSVDDVRSSLEDAIFLLGRMRAIHSARGRTPEYDSGSLLLLATCVTYLTDMATGAEEELRNYRVSAYSPEYQILSELNDGLADARRLTRISSHFSAQHAARDRSGERQSRLPLSYNQRQVSYSAYTDTADTATTTIATVRRGSYNSGSAAGSAEHRHNYSRLQAPSNNNEQHHHSRNGNNNSYNHPDDIVENDSPSPWEGRNSRPTFPERHSQTMFNSKGTPNVNDGLACPPGMIRQESRLPQRAEYHHHNNDYSPPNNIHQQNGGHYEDHHLVSNISTSSKAPVHIAQQPHVEGNNIIKSDRNGLPAYFDDIPAQGFVHLPEGARPFPPDRSMPHGLPPPVPRDDENITRVPLYRGPSLATDESNLNRLGESSAGGDNRSAEELRRLEAAAPAWERQEAMEKKKAALDLLIARYPTLPESTPEEREKKRGVKAAIQRAAGYIVD